MAKRTQTAAEAAAALAGDPKVKAAVEHEIERGSLVTALVQMRVHKGISQKQVAEKMGCDPSKISRMEAGNDAALAWSDIPGYVQALGMSMQIMFADSSLPAAQQIKQHVLQIDELLQKLTKLAKQVGDDQDLVAKIHQFNGEVLFNFLTRFQENYRELAPMVKIPPSSPDDAISPTSSRPRKTTGKLVAAS